jgi:hypothetical protein
MGRKGRVPEKVCGIGIKKRGKRLEKRNWTRAWLRTREAMKKRVTDCGRMERWLIRSVNACTVAFLNRTPIFVSVRGNVWCQ